MHNMHHISRKRFVDELRIESKRQRRWRRREDDNIRHCDSRAIPSPLGISLLPPAPPPPPPPRLSLSVIYAFVHRLFHIKYKLGNLRFIDMTEILQGERAEKFFMISNERLEIEADSTYWTKELLNLWCSIFYYSLLFDLFTSFILYFISLYRTFYPFIYSLFLTEIYQPNFIILEFSNLITFKLIYSIMQFIICINLKLTLLAHRLHKSKTNFTLILYVASSFSIFY